MTTWFAYGRCSTAFRKGLGSVKPKAAMVPAQPTALSDSQRLSTEAACLGPHYKTACMGPGLEAVKQYKQGEHPPILLL